MKCIQAHEYSADSSVSDSDRRKSVSKFPNAFTIAVFYFYIRLLSNDFSKNLISLVHKSLFYYKKFLKSAEHTLGSSL